MAVLSVDLAFRRWSDVGIVVLNRPQPDSAFGLNPTLNPIACQIIPSNAAGLDDGPIDPNILAGRLNHLCAVAASASSCWMAPKPGSRRPMALNTRA